MKRTLKKSTKKAVNLVLSLILILPLMSGHEVVKATESYIWPINETQNTSDLKSYTSGHCGFDVHGTASCEVVATMSGTVEIVYSGCNNSDGAGSGGTRCKDKGKCNPNCGYTGANKDGSKPASYHFCNWGFGNGLIVKNSDGTYAIYAHMKSVSVKKGDTVKQGQKLGIMGSAGYSTGRHLHFEVCKSVSISGTYYNPLNNFNPFTNPPPPFKVTNATVPSLTQTTAKIHADVTATCSQLSEVGVQWGKTTSLSEKAISWSKLGNTLTYIEVAFDGGAEGPKLSSGTTYYYRYYAKKKDGTYIYDTTRNFTTLPPPGPTTCTHSYNSGKVTQNPTCTATGIKTYTCTKCNATKTETVAATGHKEVKDAAVEATCNAEGKTAGTHCSVCGAVIKAQATVNKKEHSFDKGKVTKEATCEETGVKTYTCKVCGTAKTETIKTVEHDVVEDEEVEPTCIAEGKTAGSHCSMCGKVISGQKSIPKGDHVYVEKSISKATTSRDGVRIEECTGCGKTHEYIIPSPEFVELSQDEYIYSGKAQKPKVTVWDSEGDVIDQEYYSVNYTSNKSVGQAKVTVNFKGNYSGKLRTTYTITPKETKIAKLTAKSRGFQVKWKKQTNQTTGYEIEYSTSNQFIDDLTKTVNVKSNTTTSKKVSKLKSGQTYFVRVRSYKTAKIDGVSAKVYSAWSDVEVVKAK